MKTATTSPQIKHRGPKVSVRKAAPAIGESYRLLLRAVNEGTLPSYPSLGHRRLVIVAELEEHIRAHRTGPEIPQSQGGADSRVTNSEQLDLFTSREAEGGRDG